MEKFGKMKFADSKWGKLKIIWLKARSRDKAIEFSNENGVWVYPFLGECYGNLKDILSRFESIYSGVGTPTLLYLVSHKGKYLAIPAPANVSLFKRRLLSIIRPENYSYKSDSGRCYYRSKQWKTTS